MSFSKCPSCNTTHDRPRCPICHTPVNSPTLDALKKEGIELTLVDNKLEIKSDKPLTESVSNFIKFQEKRLITALGGTISTGIGSDVANHYPWMKNNENCQCKDYIAIMDKWGASTCGVKVRTIAGWLYQVAIKKEINLSFEQIHDDILSIIKNKQAPIADWPFVWTYWEDGAKGDELKYSIRSLLHWYPDAQVVIVGDKPSWYTGQFISSPRIGRRPFQAFLDCYTKLQLAADTIPQFVWMMDDIYWVKDFSIEEAITPKYVRHVSQEKYRNWVANNAWAKTRAKAYDWLLNNNYPTYDFAGHLPQPIISSTFKEMENKVHILDEYRNWECIYFNMFYVKDAIDYGRSYKRITKALESFSPKFPIMNHTDSCYKGTIETYLSQQFPEPCKYEDSQELGVLTTPSTDRDNSLIQN